MDAELYKLQKENEALKEFINKMLADCKVCKEQYEELIKGLSGGQ